jgi:hypothetical protein
MEQGGGGSMLPMIQSSRGGGAKAACGFCVFYLCATVADPLAARTASGPTRRFCLATKKTFVQYEAPLSTMFKQ